MDLNIDSRLEFNRGKQTVTSIKVARLVRLEIRRKHRRRRQHQTGNQETYKLNNRNIDVVMIVFKETLARLY